MALADLARLLIEIEELQKRIYDWSNNCGWWSTEEDRNIPSKLALMHSELSEALEIHRKPLQFSDGVQMRVDEIGYLDKVLNNIEREQLPDNSRKPEGFGVELADCIIRILDTAEFLGIDIGKCLFEKQLYNETRPYKHGGKRV